MTPAPTRAAKKSGPEQRRPAKASPRSPARKKPIGPPKDWRHPYSTPLKTAYSDAGLRKARLIALFMAEHLVHMDGEYAFKPFVLDEFQLTNIVRPIFADVDRHEKRKIRKALVGLPRWGGKSEIMAGLVLACMFVEPKYQGQYYVVARDKNQARIIFNKAKTMVLRDPMLRRACTVFKDEIHVNETGAIFKVLPGDRKSVEGLHADVCLIDEYHVHRDDGIYSAMTSGMIGNWKSGGLLLVTSTAGHERKGPLWNLIKQLRKDPHGYVYWVGAEDDDDPDDPATWAKCCPMPWVTLADIKEAHNTLQAWEFERYHLNRFPSSGAAKAFSAKRWDELAKRKPDISIERRSALAVDASWWRDSTAFVLDQIDENGDHNVLCWIFYSDEPGKHINRELVKARLLEICEEHDVQRIACDSNFFKTTMLELEAEYGLPVESFPQKPEPMAAASMNLAEIIQAGRIRPGKDPELRAHVLNAGVQPTPYGWRIGRLEDDMKIDAAIALAIATYIVEMGEVQEYADVTAIVA